MKKTFGTGSRLSTALLFAAVALVAVTAVTVAWFSIADATKLQSLRMDVTSGMSMRFDLDAHDSFGEYQKILNFGQIAERIARDTGSDVV